MTTASSTAPRGWVRLIIDHNPCYLLSGICMLMGCFLLSSALYTSAGDVRNLLVLLGTINLYEVLLVLLGLALIRRPAFVRDGRILLGLEALFLADVTFIVGTISTVDASWGAAVNAVLLVLAGIKLAVILPALGSAKPWRIWLIAMLTLAAILFWPTILKSISLQRNGNVPAWYAYAGWLIGGLLPVVGLAIWQFPGGQSARPAAERAMSGAFILLGYLSLLIHLYSAAWVYAVAFTPAFFSPILLGLAIALGGLERWAVPKLIVARVQLLAAMLAVAFSLQFPAALTLSAGITLTPLRLALLAALATCIFAAWNHRDLLARPFILLALLFLASALLGPTTTAIWANGTGLVMMVYSMPGRIMPRTTLGWGVAAVASSFLLLAIGAVASLRKSVRLGMSPAAIED